VIYASIKKVRAGESIANMRHLNPKIRILDLIASVTAAIEGRLPCVDGKVCCCPWGI
jgi:hypothetical protein